MRFLELVPIGLEGFVGEDVRSIDEEVDGGFLQLGGFVTVAQLEHLQHVVHAQMRLQNANAVGLQFFQRVLRYGKGEGESEIEEMESMGAGKILRCKRCAMCSF